MPAVNMTLHTFAAGIRCQRQSLSPACRVVSSKLAACHCQLMGRRMDGRVLFHRTYSAYCVVTVSKLEEYCSLCSTTYAIYKRDKVHDTIHVSLYTLQSKTLIYAPHSITHKQHFDINSCGN